MLFILLFCFLLLLRFPLSNKKGGKPVRACLPNRVATQSPLERLPVEPERQLNDARVAAENLIRTVEVRIAHSV
jgi:hypothetical protein